MKVCTEYTLLIIRILLYCFTLNSYCVILNLFQDLEIPSHARDDTVVTILRVYSRE